MYPLPRRLLPLCLLLAGCGGDGTTDPPRTVATVTVSPNPAQVRVGQTLQLTATPRDAGGGAITGLTPTWSTGDAAVATVAASGLVSGEGAGTARITAEIEGVEGFTDVLSSVAPPEGPGAWVAGGGKVGSSRISTYWGNGPAVGYWSSIDLGTPVAGTGGAMEFRSAGAGSPTRSVLFAGGYQDGTAADATNSAVLAFPADNRAVALEMTAARLYHTITPLAGSRALVAGGFDDGPVSSAEIFDESAQEFVVTGSMGKARGNHAAAPLSDGRVLVTGGSVPVGAGPATDLDDSAEIFDPASGTFSPTGSMGVARTNHSAIALDDGRVLVLGGFAQNSAEVFDPVSETFSPVGDMEVVHGFGHQAVKLQDGRVLVLGGDTGAINPTAAAEIFDPATDEFTRIADMTTTRMLHFAVLLDDGSVLIGGGQDDDGDILDSAERFDPATNVFVPMDDMPLPGSEHAAAPVTLE